MAFAFNVFRRPLIAAALAFVCVSLPMSAAAEAPRKPVLGVLKLQDETGAMPFQGGVGRVMTNILTNELAARLRFTVVERRRLMAILEEQDLAASGRLKPGDGAKIGQLTGADYLVMGTVTAFERGVEKRKSSGFIGVLGGGKNSETAYLAVDLRVVDTTTGEIAYARSIEGRTTKTQTSMNVNLGAAGFGYESLQSDADAKVVRSAIIEIIDYLECAMVIRDACLNAYAEKEQRRTDTTRKVLKHDGARR
jgi:curli biogenesis system outer membrane secretion channel CsgG